MDVAISLAKNYLVGIEEKDEKINYLLLADKGEKSVIKYINRTAQSGKPNAVGCENE